MKQKNIILIQFRTDYSATKERAEIFRHLRIKKRQFKIVNAFDKIIDFSRPKKIIGIRDKVILGGSGEFCFSGKNIDQDKSFWKMIKRVTPLVRYLIKEDVPTLGICFGHQLIGYSLGVEVVKDKSQQEIGSFPTFLTEQGTVASIFFNLPRKFITQLAHKDSLKCLPKGAVLLAKSRKCKIQSFQYKKNIYGVQFHPELNYQDVIDRFKLYPDYAFGKNIDQIIKQLKPSPESLKIFRNFLRFT